MSMQQTMRSEAAIRGCRLVRSARSTLRAFVRASFVAACLSSITVGGAGAHPHVWVTMKSELVYAADGLVTGVRHAWTFDDMYSAFATQGLEQKRRGTFARAELAALAEVNISSLKEYGYFTSAKANGKKRPFGEPIDYWLDYADSLLTLHFTLPFKTPVKAKLLKIDIYDATIFVDFAFAKQHPVSLAGAPAGCKFDTVLPREMTFDEGKALSDIPIDQPNLTMTWGAKFANKILVNCP